MGRFLGFLGLLWLVCGTGGTALLFLLAFYWLPLGQLTLWTHVFLYWVFVGNPTDKGKEDYGHYDTSNS